MSKHEITIEESAAFVDAHYSGVQRPLPISVSIGDLGKRGKEKSVAQMGWEQRGTNFYYYRKEREGSRVKSTYVGRGEIAHLISQFQASSTAVERIPRANSLRETKNTEAALDLVTELIQLLTDAALLTAGFHTHKRQWRRKRNARGTDYRQSRTGASKVSGFTRQDQQGKSAPQEREGSF